MSGPLEGVTVIDLTDHTHPHTVATIALPFNARCQCLVADDSRLVVADACGGSLAVIDVAARCDIRGAIQDSIDAAITHRFFSEEPFVAVEVAVNGLGGFAGVVVWDEKYRVMPETLTRMSAAIAPSFSPSDAGVLNSWSSACSTTSTASCISS